MRQQTVSVEQLERMRNYAVYSNDGEKIGSLEDLYVDEQSQRPEWIGLGTGFFGTKRVLVPTGGVSFSEDRVTVPYSKDQVKDAPDLDSDVIDPETERALYAYYSRGGRAETDDLAETVKQEAVTRSEEELRVGKREEELGHLRIHKWVETEDVEVPVEVRREKARVTREPVDETVSDEAIGEDSLEIILREERPVVEKETVAKERIGIEKDVEVDQETVEGKVRKERVEVEDDTKRYKKVRGSSNGAVEKAAPSLSASLRGLLAVSRPNETAGAPLGRASVADIDIGSEGWGPALLAARGATRSRGSRSEPTTSSPSLRWWPAISASECLLVFLSACGPVHAREDPRAIRDKPFPRSAGETDRERENPPKSAPSYTSSASASTRLRLFS